MSVNILIIILTKLFFNFYWLMFFRCPVFARTRRTLRATCSGSGFCSFTRTVLSCSSLRANCIERPPWLKTRNGPRRRSPAQSQYVPVYWCYLSMLHVRLSFVFISATTRIPSRSVECSGKIHRRDEQIHSGSLRPQ